MSKIKHVKTTALAQAMGLALFGTMTSAAMASAPAVASSKMAEGSRVAQSAASAQQQTSDQAAEVKAKTTASTKKEKKKVTNLNTVEVIGSVRHSILFSTDAKRRATNIVDTIFAQGIGKLPDINIAESLNNVPGVQLARSENGQGLQVSIRGLGSSFTKVTLNGASVDTANLAFAQQNQNREVNLNLFPSQFFTELRVSKTPKASMIAGGIAGNVDLRTLRPFDNPGKHLTYNLTETYTKSVGHQYSPQGSLIGSWTNDSGTFGALVGVSQIRTKKTFSGFGSIGWTTPGLTYAQCGIAPPAGTSPNIAAPSQASCNSIGGGNWRIPDSVPNTAGAGLTPGDTIDSQFLLDHNPSLTIGQISNALIPRLARPLVYNDGEKMNSGIMSFEFRPNENMDYWLDAMYSGINMNSVRYDMDLVGRNGNMIPLDLQVGDDNVVQKGTFTNAQFFLEDHAYLSKSKFWSVDPGANIYIGDNLKLHVQGHVRRSWLNRQTPSVLVNSPFTTIQYDNSRSGLPTWTLPTGVDLNNPDLGWTWNRLNIQNQHRFTHNKGLEADLRLGDDDNNLDVGFAYNQEGITIRAYDNSTAWQKLVCDGSGDICDGGPGSLITTADIANYLTPGPTGFININNSAFFAASKYYALAANAPISQSTAQGATSGGFSDRDWGFFVETNTTGQILGRPLHLNVGVRYVTTDSDLHGPVLVNGANQIKSFSTGYSNFLPSFNMAWDVLPSVVIRMAGSRSMSRPNPSSMLPDTNFSDPSAETATQGNPGLKPYLSTNFDLGGEWYTGGAGYVGLDLFAKHINGFTVNGVRTIPFQQLGVPYASLLPVQQMALQQRGGPNVATVDVQSQVNADGTLKITGEELDWVQPLDWLVPGLGFTANFSHVHQTSSGSGVPAVAVGISPKMFKSSLYYERGPFSIHLIFDHQDGGIASGANQNGIPYARLLFGAHKQLDLSASYTLKWIPSTPQITLDALNITNSSIVTYFASQYAVYSKFNPGRTIMLGIRGSF